MVRSGSADGSIMSGKSKVAVGSEDDDELNWSYSNRSASSSCNVSSPENVTEMSDRRIRRQIANCNERRRMQSINAGFQSLRSLLPKGDVEKLSKAAILQQTAELIQNLKAEKLKLMEEKEAVLNGRKRKINDETMQERCLIDELTVALEQERRLRQLYEQRLLNLRAVTPLLSQIVPVSQSSCAAVEQTTMQMTNTLLSSTNKGFLSNLHLNDFLGILPFNSFGAQSSVLNTSDDCRVAAANCSNSSSVPGSNLVSRDEITAAARDNLNAGLFAQNQSAMLVNAMQNESTVALSHRNLNAILEAIKQLENGVSHGATVAEQKPNVLVH